MTMTQQTNSPSTGKGSSKVITPEQHEAARKAAQARKRANRSTTRVTNRRTDPNKSKGGFTWQPKDYRDTPMFEASRPKHEVDPFDVMHADLAISDEVFTAKLATGSPAHVLATRALVEYPKTSPEGNLERSYVAIMRAVALTPEEFTIGVIERASWVVKAALKRTRKAARIRAASASVV
jgi:hypothetical protein